MLFKTAIISTLAVRAAAVAIASPEVVARSSKYPFDQLVAYGNEWSDNGNGSYAHGYTAGSNVYGFGTWTNGPVAVSYLSNLLKIPLLDFAFGGCCGGSEFGATVDNSYIKSVAESPSLVDQVANYTGHHHINIEKTLQFIWIGEHDLVSGEHSDWFWYDDPRNAQFAGNISTRIAAQVEKLLETGAPAVFVANIVPNHLAPVTSHYLCTTMPNTACVHTLSMITQQANAAIKAALEKFGTKVICYDAFSYISSLVANKNEYGFTNPLTWFCDGNGNANWTECVTDKHSERYFWMNFLQPTTGVHELIAEDMKKTIDAHFGV